MHNGWPLNWLAILQLIQPKSCECRAHPWSTFRLCTASMPTSCVDNPRQLTPKTCPALRLPQLTAGQEGLFPLGPGRLRRVRLRGRDLLPGRTHLPGYPPLRCTSGVRSSTSCSPRERSTVAIASSCSAKRRVFLTRVSRCWRGCRPCIPAAFGCSPPLTPANTSRALSRCWRA